MSQNSIDMSSLLTEDFASHQISTGEDWVEPEKSEIDLHKLMEDN